MNETGERVLFQFGNGWRVESYEGWSPINGVLEFRCLVSPNGRHAWAMPLRLSDMERVHRLPCRN